MSAIHVLYIQSLPLYHCTIVPLLYTQPMTTLTVPPLNVLPNALPNTPPIRPRMKPRQPAARRQDGYLFEVKRSDGEASFHIRYRVNEIIDGVLTRVQRSAKLVEKDDVHFSMTCAAVVQAQRAFMSDKNQVTGNQDMLVVDFWEREYVPHLQKNNRKASTLSGYLGLWNRLLLPLFVNLRLGEVTCPMVSEFLTKLVDDRKLGRRSISHVHSLGSGMFRLAKKRGLVKANPFTDASSDTRPHAPKPTYAYSLSEAITIVNALNGRPESQLVFVLAAFLGLRPGEISGLKWSDFRDGFVFIERSAWKSIAGTTKTLSSVGSIWVPPSLNRFVDAWRVLCMPTPDGWCFPNPRGGPRDMNSLSRRSIQPTLKAQGIAWHGLYAGRRGSATLLMSMTGNSLAASAVLRNDPRTTEQFYAKLRKEDAMTGDADVRRQAEGCGVHTRDAAAESLIESLSNHISPHITSCMNVSHKRTTDSEVFVSWAASFAHNRDDR